MVHFIGFARIRRSAAIHYKVHNYACQATGTLNNLFGINVQVVLNMVILNFTLFSIIN